MAGWSEGSWVSGKAKGDTEPDKVHICDKSYLGGLGGKTACGLTLDPYFWIFIERHMQEFVVLEKCPGCFGFPDENCESGCEAPVMHHDSDMVPLCDKCWAALLECVEVEDAALPPCEFRNMEDGEIYCQHKEAIEGATPEAECRECMEVE
jgi:hypothetical protein